MFSSNGFDPPRAFLASSSWGAQEHRHQAQRAILGADFGGPVVHHGSRKQCRPPDSRTSQGHPTSKAGLFVVVVEGGTAEIMIIWRSKKNATSHRYLRNLWELVFLCKNTTSKIVFINMPSYGEPLFGQPCVGVPTHLVQATTNSLDSAAKSHEGRSACDGVGLYQLWAACALGLHGEHSPKLSCSGAPPAVLA